MTAEREGGGRRIGVWFNGARGSVGATAICGLTAIRLGLTPPTGCVTERLDAPAGALPDWADIVIGGHDIVGTPLRKRIEQLAGAGLVPARLLPALEPHLDRIDAELRPGYDPVGYRGTLSAAADRLTADLTRFRHVYRLSHVVVVNVASTEPVLAAAPEHASLDLLRRAMNDPNRRSLPASSLVAYAAIAAGCSYVDFTPSPGIRVPALMEFARSQPMVYAGHDGKTGETLLRTVLAPMFRARNLTVRSWSGTNLLGGGDGANLADPVRAGSKLESKRRGLTALLGAEVNAPLHIDNVPDLGEQKVAWDHVSFEGFLGARMTLQLCWTGWDSALAAPLVLDLARLAAAAYTAGLRGPLGALAAFFKDPLDCDEHRFGQQMELLRRWVAQLPVPR